MKTEEEKKILERCSTEKSMAVMLCFLLSFSRISGLKYNQIHFYFKRVDKRES
jgi:hypothetical protein